MQHRELALGQPPARLPVRRAGRPVGLQVADPLPQTGPVVRGEPPPAEVQRAGPVQVAHGRHVPQRAAGDLGHAESFTRHGPPHAESHAQRVERLVPAAGAEHVPVLHQHLDRHPHVPADRRRPGVRVRPARPPRRRGRHIPEGVPVRPPRRPGQCGGQCGAEQQGGGERGERKLHGALRSAGPDRMTAPDHPTADRNGYCASPSRSRFRSDGGSASIPGLRRNRERLAAPRDARQPPDPQ